MGRAAAILALAVLGAPGLGALACAGPPELEADPVPLAAFPSAAQDAICAWAVRCRHVPDDATCRRLLDPKDYDGRRAADAVAAGRLWYDPAAAGRCLASVPGAACLGDPYGDSSCGDVWDGLVPVGGACVAHWECAGRSLCEERSCDGQCCAGRCGAEPPSPPPVPAPRAPGERCETHADCGDDAYCEYDRRCAALPDEPGEHCLYGCAFGDLYCDVHAELCRAWARLGEACDEARPCDPAFSYCDETCRPIPDVGEPCGPDPRQPCVPVATCDAATGLCVARGGPGAPCEDDEACTVGCDGEAGVCVEYETCEI